MAKKKTLKDGHNGEVIYPLTITEQVVGKDGKTVERVIDDTFDGIKKENDSRFANMQATINAAQLEIGAVQTDEVPTEGSGNFVNSGGVYRAFNSKEFVDDEPKTDSEKLVKSGGVFKSVEPVKYISEPSKNLVVKDYTTLNVDINTSTGNTRPSTDNSSVSQYIPIVEGKKYAFANGFKTSAYAFYNSDKSFFGVLKQENENTATEIFNAYYGGKQIAGKVGSEWVYFVSPVTGYIRLTVKPETYNANRNAYARWDGDDPNVLFIEIDDVNILSEHTPAELWELGGYHVKGLNEVKDIAERALTTAENNTKTKDIVDKIIERRVLNNPEEYSDGYIVAKDGRFVSSTTWKSTDYISVTPGKIVAGVTFNFGQAALFDSAKIFLDNNPNGVALNRVFDGGTRNGWTYFTVPENSSYLRISEQVAQNVLTDAMLIEVDDVEELDAYDAFDIIQYDDVRPFGYKELTSGYKELTSKIDSLLEIVSNYSGELKDKKIIVLGDSMVYGNNLGTQYAWAARIAERNGMKYEVNSTGHSELSESIIINAGVNGVMLSNNNAPFATNINNAIINRYGFMDDDADYVLVFGGTNDGWKLSRKEMELGEEDSTDNTTFFGALNVLMQGLLTKYPKGKIAFITPYADGSEVRNNVINAIKTAAKNNGGIPVFDNSLNGGIDWTNDAQKEALTQKDDVHLNIDGHIWVSSKYESFIKSL